MKSIQWKLVAIHIIVVLIVLITSGIFILWRIEKYEYGEYKKILANIANEFQTISSVHRIESDILNSINNQVVNNATFYNNRDVEVFVTDLNGNYLSSTIALSDSQKKNVFNRSNVISAISGDSAYEIYKVINKNSKIEEVLAYSIPIKVNQSVKYIVNTRIFTNKIKEALNENRIIILISICIALAVTGVIGYIFASTVTEPIKDLTSSAKEMARGKLHQRISVKSNDEIGQLTKSFNHMAFELNKTLSDMSREKNKLEQVFEHMKDGIIAFNADGLIIHSNPATYEILECDFIGDNFYYLFDKLNLEVNFSEILNMSTSDIKKFELNTNDKFINIVVANYLNDKKEPEGVIVMLQNITKQKKLDDMRKEFVANVSHELRTPLTTVKSYVETIIDSNLDDKEMALKFLDTINSESDRMALLVQDLLQLSKFDNKQIKFERKEENLVDLVKNTVEQYKIQAKNKNQYISFDTEIEEIVLFIDKARISQVLNNILSNALKYSLENDKINVNINNKEDIVEVVIKDTGMGIPKEDLPRIFERFYRVDKARSRSMGGTGLGLSIAKEIMEYHGGTINIDSIYGQGTTVTLVFPQVKNI